MTTTKSIIIILISLLTSNLITAQQIQKFESSLGKKRTVAINEIVNDFEKYLDSNFSGQKLDTKYDKYLEKLSQGNLSKKWRISPSKVTKYKKPLLFGICSNDSGRRLDRICNPIRVNQGFSIHKS